MCNFKYDLKYEFFILCKKDIPADKDKYNVPTCKF